ncbi:MAG: DUF882 domain-containing protein [Pseudomonadota bacterium]
MSKEIAARARPGAWHEAIKLGFMAFFALALMSGLSTARAETRTLEMYYVNTGEKTAITFKKNGRYIASGLDKMNRFLRDWRRKEHIKMDPRLFDLVWEVRKAAGSRRAVHVVSAYRSPATNAMLRRTRGGQATKSQHMVGRAMDFYIPGVKASTLRKIGLRKGWGGVGYYPRSGSPYVHLDTGRVRHWPRMSRKQLVAVFPNGRTLHVPTDGKPLKGYKLAQADDKRIRAGKSPVSRGGGGGLLAALRGGGNDDDDVADAVPTPRPVRTAAVPRAPIPAGAVAGSGFDSDGASAGGGSVPAPEPEPVGPIELPLQVASPVFNPLTPAPVTTPTAITPDGTPAPEGPLTPDAPEQSEVLVARAPGEEDGEEDSTLVAALTVTDIVPRQRPLITEPEVPAVDGTLVASIPQPDFRPPASAVQTDIGTSRFGNAPVAEAGNVNLASIAPTTPAKFNRAPAGDPVTSPRFNSRISVAHAFAPEASPSARARAVLEQLRGTPLRAASSDNSSAATAPAQVAVVPRAAPRNEATVATVVTTTAPAPQPAAPQNTGLNTDLAVAAPQFDVASASEFTEDGAMALGTLNGATVLGWAITPLDPIKVQARGLRAPAYGQNALRAAPAKVLQKQLRPIGSEPQWTSFDSPKPVNSSPLKLARLD